jgi:hypothetical protein
MRAGIHQRSETGSVSIYLLLSLTACIVLFGILSDFLRIRMAELQAERAVKAGLRSVMSAFNPELAGYGLFGMTLPEKEQKEIFDKIVDEHVSTSPDTFRFASIVRTDEERLQQVYTLASQAVFEHQVLETMKYSAPIEFASEVSGKFRSLKSDFQMSKTFMDSAVELEELMETREDQLDEAWSELTSLKEDLQRKAAQIEKSVQLLNQLTGRIGAARVEQVEQSVRAIEQSIAATTMAGGVPSISVFQALAQQRQLLSDLLSYERTTEELKSLINEQAELMEDRKQRVIRHVNEAEETDKQISSLVKSKGSGSGLGEGADQAIAGVKVYGATYFEAYREDLEQIADLLETSNQQLDQLYGKRSIITYNTDYMRQLESVYSSMEQEDQSRKETRRSIQKQKKEARREAEKQREEANKLAATSCSQQDRTHYERMEGKKGFFEKYISFHQSEKESKITSDESVEAASSGMMELLLQGADMLEALRDHAYIGEYAMSYFNYRTMEIDLKNQPSANKARFDGRKLAGQEIEYILYGLGGCQTNMAAAYGEMFAIRLAIRTTEALMDPATRAAGAGSPLLFVLTALAQGAAEAYQDMTHLIRGDTVVLSDKLTSIKVSYADHLRLFLYLHPGSSGKLARMQSLIELNTSLDLTKSTSYLYGTQYFRTRLLFMPTLIGKVSSSWLKGEAEGGVYEFGISAVYSY